VVRASDQGELQVNGWSSLADGLLKRSPTTFVKKLLSGSAVPALAYHINRDTAERYIVVASGGQLRVFDLNGVEQTVHAPAGWGYLASATNPETDIRFTTVADYTFVVNKKASPAMKAYDPATDPPPETIPPPDYYIPPAGGAGGYWDGLTYLP
jgi:hypothetical protein